MGAWGHGNFENDDALDWVAELEESGQAAIDAALGAVTTDAEDYIEAPECSKALAAAETVAAMRGKPATKLPEEVSTWVKGKPAPNPATIKQAATACDAVLTDSELKELWEESGDFEQWRSSVADLNSRLV